MYIVFIILYIYTLYIYNYILQCTDGTDTYSAYLKTKHTHTPLVSAGRWALKTRAPRHVMLAVGGTYHDWGWVMVLGSLHYLYLFVIITIMVYHY
jgi:hypothetical protein